MGVAAQAGPGIGVAAKPSQLGAASHGESGTCLVLASQKGFLRADPGSVPPEGPLGFPLEPGGAKPDDPSVKHVAMLPNLFTLANAGCGLLAISKAIDALALGKGSEAYHSTFEQACWLIMFALLLDALDGKVARMTDSFSDFGAQLDSFADAITFGVAPAMLGKVLLEAEGLYHPRLNFFAAAAFSLMAVLRLARFNVGNEHGEEHHRMFQGLPSPAAAGTLVITILMSFSLGGGIEGSGAGATAVGKGLSFVPEAWRHAIATAIQPAIIFMLPGLGLMMVSRIPYAHGFGALFRSGGFPTLVKLVFVFLGLYLAPVPVLFFTGYTYVLLGLYNALRNRGAASDDLEAERGAA